MTTPQLGTCDSYHWEKNRRPHYKTAKCKNWRPVEPSAEPSPNNGRYCEHGVKCGVCEPAREPQRETIARAIWNAEIEEEVRHDKRLLKREAKDFAQWPEDAARQPYCQSTYRIADAVVRALGSPSERALRGADSVAGEGRKRGFEGKFVFGAG